MARRSAADIQKAKAAKQKKLLLLLLPLFLGLVAWQGPKMYGALFGGSAAEPQAATTTTAPTGTTPAPTATTPTGVLADTDLPPEADVAKLISFSRFTGHDPFLSPNGSGSSTPETTPPPAGTPTGDEELTAVIEVNGSSETVAVGEEFPASDPTFTLVSLTLEGATIGVVQGMFEDGSATVEIAVGEEIILVAAPDSTQYTVKLLDVMN